MTIHRSTTPLSRRSAVTGLATGAILLTGVATPSHAAQEASPVAARAPWHSHPVVGTWQWVSNPVHPSSAVIAADGTYLEYDPLLGVGIGLWRATGEQTADVVVTFQEVARAWGVFASDAAPEAPAFRSDRVVDLVTMRVSIGVDPEGNALTATGSITAHDASGKVVSTLDQYTGSAERLQADTST